MSLHVNLKELADHFDPNGKERAPELPEVEEEGCQAYRECPASGLPFRDYLRAKYDVSLAEFNRWPIMRREEVYTCWSERIGLSYGRLDGPMFSADLPADQSVDVRLAVKVVVFAIALLLAPLWVPGLLAWLRR